MSIRRLIVVAAVTASAMVANASIRVGSYNIRTQFADKKTENAWNRRRADLIALLRRIDYDVVGLQESFVEQSAYITNSLPGYALIGSIDGAEEKSGVTSPVCYRTARFEPVKSGTFWLSKTPDAPGGDVWDAWSHRKTCVWALLKDRVTGKVFCFINTHTDHKGKIARLEGIRLIMRRMDEIVPKGTPVVFTGDHNCHENSDPAQEAAKHLKDALFIAEKPPKGPWRTYNGRNWRDREITIEEALKMSVRARNSLKTFSGVRVDYIYVSDGVRVLDYAVDASPRPGKTGLYPSDHFPLVATIQLP